MNVSPGSIDGKSIKNIDIENIDIDHVDESVRLAILTVLAGYLEKDKIKVEGSEFIDVNYLNSFLSYVLNDKRAAPRKFSLDISFNNSKNVISSKENSNYDLLLSFSGGADSTAGLLHAKDMNLKVKPVYIGFGQKKREARN